MTYLRISGDPVSSAAACSAAMKLDPVFVPDVSSSRTLALFECNLVTWVVRPEDSEFAADRATTFKDL
jgi:hypothetical protein